MYELHTTLIASDGYVMDKKTTKFGIRDIKFDADEGFLLNGKSVKIKGTYTTTWDVWVLPHTMMPCCDAF
jgi:beta-galactosidase/beta-glucuronidase